MRVLRVSRKSRPTGERLHESLARGRSRPKGEVAQGVHIPSRPVLTPGGV